MLDSIELFRELAREEGCYGAPKAFVDAHTRLSYFRGADVHPDYPLFQTPGSKVTLMCGLPASGRTPGCASARACPWCPYDDAREALGLKHGENDGKAAHHATDMAKALLREARPFVWNATHLSRQMRSKALDLCYAYGAEVRIVYLEQPRDELLRRNGKRDTTLSNKALLGMLHRWELPVPSEAHEVRYEVEGAAAWRLAGRRPGRAALRLKSDAPVRAHPRSGKIPSSVRRATRLAARHVSPSGHWRASSRCGHASRKPDMNRIYKLVRHRVSGAWIVVSEIARGRGQEAASGAPVRPLCGGARCRAKAVCGRRLVALLAVSALLSM